MYGCENWVWQKKNESRINAMEMRSLRNMCGVSEKDRCVVREQCGEDVVTRVEGALKGTELRTKLCRSDLQRMIQCEGSAP
ncbi:hypothetical protein EVAR_76071_1 [Eumeta japonica]|uniref:Uncharacterized protein n=1 Tax=Eumeta variegata TaxID=151549 RepID=A0A4C1W2N4_EUMVA|nr:hypothetical protein EVAR_76071_1 [Eumeta japonica]